jgi:hypothetical protein
MTQAINLANFSNSLDSSGGVPPTQLNAVVPISKGGTNASTAATARTNLDVAQAIYSVPSGGIIMWSGSIASIPTGWYLCNGLNSTPDLRNRFIIGAYADNSGVANTTITGSNTQTGGSKDASLVSHTHTTTVTDPGHFHSNGVIYPYNGTGSRAEQNQSGGAEDFTSFNVSTGSKTTGISVTNTTEGVAATNANLVPYYALAFIMKS